VKPTKQCVGCHPHPPHRKRCAVQIRWWIRWLAWLPKDAQCFCTYWDARWEEGK
jgi:hypothetical protein